MNRQGTRWRGQLPVPIHAHPLVRKLIEEANTQHTTLTEIADRAGLSVRTISEWRYTRSPTVLNLVAALNVLGMDLVITRQREQKKTVNSGDKLALSNGSPVQPCYPIPVDNL